MNVLLVQGAANRINHNYMNLLPKLLETVDQLNIDSLGKERKEVLQPLVEYIKEKLNSNQEVKLNFICTHNSRRSQFSQIWAQTAANYNNILVKCYSGGVKVTAFNERAVESIKRSGFMVSKRKEDNPIYSVFNSSDAEPISTFSKIYDDPINPKDGFAAIMTCSHADENCPFIVGADKRIPVRYDDPKNFDGTPQETEMYDERSMQVAAEMFYVFSKVAK